MSKEIGNRIKTIRENASLSQNEVAKYLGISKEKFAGIELGVFSPTLVILNQLAKLFNISVKTLTENIKELNYADFNIAKETKDKLDMIDLFYANKNLYEKLTHQKQGKGVNILIYSFFLSVKISDSKLFYCKVDTFIEKQFLQL